MEELQRRLSLLQPLEMRMQLRGAKDGGYLLEDTYSSDLSSLRWALEELASSAPTSRKWAVLSHLGSEEKTAEAKALAATYGLDRIWWVEKPEDVGELTTSFAGLDLNKTTVLVKGRRAYKLEQFAATLQDQYHSTWAEVNLSAMRRNLQKFKAHFGPGDEGHGHGQGGQLWVWHFRGGPLVAKPACRLPRRCFCAGSIELKG